MSDNNPFKKFAKQRVKDNIEVETLRKLQKEKGLVRLQAYKINHEKVIKLLEQLNPEPIILKLLNVGFTGNLKFPGAKVKRVIQSIFISDLITEGIRDNYDFGDDSQDVILAIDQVINNKRKLKRKIETFGIKGNVQVLLTSLE